MIYISLRRLKPASAVAIGAVVIGALRVHAEFGCTRTDWMRPPL